MRAGVCRRTFKALARKGKGKGYTFCIPRTQQEKKPKEKQLGVFKTQSDKYWISYPHSAGQTRVNPEWIDMLAGLKNTRFVPDFSRTPSRSLCGSVHNSKSSKLTELCFTKPGITTINTKLYFKVQISQDWIHQIYNRRNYAVVKQIKLKLR